MIKRRFQENIVKLEIGEKRVKNVEVKKKRFEEIKVELTKEKRTLDGDITKLRDGLSNNTTTQTVDRRTGQLITRANNANRKSFEGQLKEAQIRRDITSNKIDAFNDSITKLDFDILNMESKEIGGFVTWNTFKKRIDRSAYDKWYKGRAVVNPVSWTLEPLVPKETHKGFLYVDNQVYAAQFQTHLIDGAIWIDRPKGKFFLLSLTMRNYHIGDINLFWQDIRENAGLRVQSFNEK